MNHNQIIQQFSFEKLDVWHVILDIIELVEQFAEALPSKHGELADQLRRSSGSMAGNFAEGFGRRSKDRLRYHRYALHSGYETAAHVEVAKRKRLVTAHEHSTLRALLLRAVSMLYADEYDHEFENEHEYEYGDEYEECRDEYEYGDEV